MEKLRCDAWKSCKVKLIKGNGKLPHICQSIPNYHTHHAIHRQELVSPLQSSNSVGHASGDDAGDVDGRVLLLAAHDIEAKALLCLGQLHHTGMGVALTGCKGGHCGLGTHTTGSV